MTPSKEPTTRRSLSRMLLPVLVIAAIGGQCGRVLGQISDTTSCTINASPLAAPPNTSISVRGLCTGIRYHRTVSLLFDGQEVQAFDGQGPDYRTGFTVPGDASPGPHVIELVAPFARKSLTFGVTPEAIFCAGDCDRNDSVEVNEVVLGVTLALEEQSGDTCARLDTDGNGRITVNELVAAVHNALTGCGQCHDSLECPNGEPCVEPGGFIGCGVCQERSDECTQDADCRDRGERYICEPAQPEDCVCDPGIHLCVPGCATTAACGTNEVCDTSLRCVPKPCSGTECGPLFICLADETGVSRCVRTPCPGDGVCPGGACVNHRCYAALGMCTLPPP